MKETFGFFIRHLNKTFTKCLRIKKGQATVEYFLIFCAFAVVTFVMFAAYLKSESAFGLRGFFSGIAESIRR